MKNKFILILVFAVTFSFIFVSKTGAQTASPTPTNLTPEQKVQRFLEIVASDTAKLNLTEKRGIIGTVTDISSTQITVNDTNGNTRFIDVDELTKFSNPAAKGSFGISDIAKGKTLGILGLYNKSSRRILARFVDVMTLPRFIHAAVSTIDNVNYNFNVVTDENKTLLIDVETVTKTSVFTAADGLTKAGFSKIISGENVVVIGYPDKKDSSRIIASNIIFLPEVAKNPAINIPGSSAAGEAPSSATTAPSSTGSGKVLTPKTY